MSHIDARRLFEAADGIIQLEPKEIEHLRVCEDCRETLLVFSRHSRDSRPPQKKDGTNH